MYIYKQNDAIPWEDCVATLGFFDGVHGGHRFLLDELKTIAKNEHKISVVITFDTHPRKVLKSDFQPKLLTTLSEKTEQLASTGVDACVVLDFTRELSLLSAFDFLKDIIHNHLRVKTLLVGYDHRFGHNREDDFKDYAEYGEKMGIKVLKAGQFKTETSAHISSSEIRHSLETGDIAHANQLLTYPFPFSGRVVGGFKVGRTIGFPTANIVPDNPDKIIPAAGVYAVEVHWNGHQFKGMMNIGHRPTVQFSDELKLEVHIIDFDSDIYNRILKIEFIQRIRDEQKFKSVEELIEQLKKDKETVLSLDF